MKLILTPSPNHDSREGAPIELLILHYTGMQCGQAAVERLCDPAAKVSAHYLIEENGDIYQFVDENQRAWHAGVASWREHTDINARSIGIEIVNPGHEFGYRPFPEVQMQAVAALGREIIARHHIAPRNVIGHSDVAPARKTDPGELFDWAWLAGQGVGLWPSSYQLPVVSCQLVPEKLHAYGYTAADATPEQLIAAFQRHFRPELVNGQWDEQCEARLQWLLENSS